MISEECHKAATSLFNQWFFIDSARRYVNFGEKQEAVLITINARSAVYDSGAEGAMTESEVKALNDDLNTVIEAIESDNLRLAKDRLAALSDQTFMHALQKTVECECGPKTMAEAWARQEE